MEMKNILSKGAYEKPESKRAARNASNIDMSSIIRMGWNENPYGPSPKALEANLEAARMGHFYQDFTCKELKAALADKYGCKETEIVPGAGSSPLIEQIGKAFINPGDEVIMCPTFAAFNDMAEINQGVVVTVPFLEPFKYNLDGILNAITPKTKMIIICNPNNPTGGYVGIDAIEEFIKKVSDDVVILFDEAYIEFATADDCKSAYPFIRKYPQKPILVMRTFSKYYAMAGVRCGYVLTSEELAAGINKVPGSWIPGAAQAEAVAALTDEEYYLECKEKIVAGKEYIAGELEKLGCTVYPSQSNFIMYDPHCDIEELRSYIIDKGILTTMALGLGRVSVGTPKQNEMYITYMKEYFDIRK